MDHGVAFYRFIGPENAQATINTLRIRDGFIFHGSNYTRNLRKKQGRLGDIWHIDEFFIEIRGQQLYMWRAVDQGGEVSDILVTKRRGRRAALLFFRKMLKHQKQPPNS